VAIREVKELNVQEVSNNFKRHFKTVVDLANGVGANVSD
jgi:hypothetical protein